MNPIFLRATAQNVTGEAGTPIAFAISTPGRKRDGMKLDLTKMRFGNFNANPVSLWMHGKDPVRGAEPVGKWVTVGTRGAGEQMRIEGELVFDQEDEFARRIESKFRRGFLNAVSMMWGVQRDEDTGEMFYDLMEAGPVPIPADPEALKRALDVGGEELAADMRDMLASVRDLPAPKDIATVNVRLDDEQVDDLMREAVGSIDYIDSAAARHMRPVMMISRMSDPLDHRDLELKLERAADDLYGMVETSFGMEVPRAMVFSIFDRYFVIRDRVDAVFMKHAYKVRKDGSVDIEEGVRVFLNFTEAPGGRASEGDDSVARVAAAFRAVIERPNQPEKPNSTRQLASAFATVLSEE